MDIRCIASRSVIWDTVVGEELAGSAAVCAFFGFDTVFSIKTLFKLPEDGLDVASRQPRVAFHQSAVSLKTAERSISLFTLSAMHSC